MSRYILPVTVVDAHGDSSFSLLRMSHGNMVLYHAGAAITSGFPQKTPPEGAGAIGFLVKKGGKSLSFGGKALSAAKRLDKRDKDAYHGRVKRILSGR